MENSATTSNEPNMDLEQQRKLGIAQQKKSAGDEAFKAGDIQSGVPLVREAVLPLIKTSRSIESISRSIMKLLRPKVDWSCLLYSLYCTCRASKGCSARFWAIDRADRFLSSRNTQAAMSRSDAPDTDAPKKEVCLGILIFLDKDANMVTAPVRSHPRKSLRKSSCVSY